MPYKVNDTREYIKLNNSLNLVTISKLLWPFSGLNEPRSYLQLLYRKIKSNNIIEDKNITPKKLEGDLTEPP